MSVAVPPGWWQGSDGRMYRPDFVAPPVDRHPSWSAPSTSSAEWDALHGVHGPAAMPHAPHGWGEPTHGKLGGHSLEIAIGSVVILPAVALFSFEGL